jgi:hypothetical protein
MKLDQVNDLILQSLEHEMGGVKIYELALSCAVNDDLKEEWTKYLDQTRTHVTILKGVCKAFKIDAAQETTSRTIVRGIGEALLAGMRKAKAAGHPGAAELVACECVVIAETKDHADWELLAKCADATKGEAGKALREACDTVEDQEDEHLYHTKGWCRELWLKSLGLSAVIPPPEEQHHVKTAIGAARAEIASEKGR